MIIHIVPRIHFEQIKGSCIEDDYKSKYRIISIKGKGEDYPFTGDHPNVLKLNFDDITTEAIAKEHDLILFNYVHANQIMEFINKPSDLPIFVHCTAGVCRSGAVGEFLNDYLNRYKMTEATHMDWIHNINEWAEKIIPNVHVKSVLYGYLREVGY